MSVTPGLLQRCLVTFEEEASREVTCAACYTGEPFLEWELLDRLTMLPKQLVLRWRPAPASLIDTLSSEERQPAPSPRYLELISRLMRRPGYS